MLSVNRLFVLLFAFSIGSFAQERRPPSRPKIIEAQPQPAQSVTIHLSADLATALETLRLNTRESKTDADGVTITAPMYANLKTLVEAALRGQGGFFRQVLTKFPHGSIKTSQEAAVKAKQEADAAAEKALK